MADLRIRPAEARKPPCKKDGVDCPLRRVGCHSNCKDFKIYREGIDESAKARAKYKVGYDYYMASKEAHLARKAKEHKKKSQYRKLCGGKNK